MSLGHRAFLRSEPGKFLLAERGEVWSSRLAGGQEIAGSNPAVLTDNRALTWELTYLAQWFERQFR